MWNFVLWMEWNGMGWDEMGRTEEVLFILPFFLCWLADRYYLTLLYLTLWDFSMLVTIFSLLFFSFFVLRGQLSRCQTLPTLGFLSHESRETRSDRGANMVRATACAMCLCCRVLNFRGRGSGLGYVSMGPFDSSRRLDSIPRLRLTFPAVHPSSRLTCPSWSPMQVIITPSTECPST